MSCSAYIWSSIFLLSAASAQVAPQAFGPPTTNTAIAVTVTPRSDSMTASPISPPHQVSANDSGDELARLSFVIDILAFLTTVLTIVGGYTVYRSHSEVSQAKTIADATLSEAKATLDKCAPLHTELQALHQAIVQQVNEDRTAFTDDLTRAKTSYAERMEQELELFRHQLHESATINRTKTHLMELLVGDSPSADDVFPLLTDILNYPDQRSIEIYERLLASLGTDREIVSKVTLGLRLFRERHFKSG